ncbi:hypothetical protein BJV78DRAFT_1118294 [Lactifluus subvellereus]|nr:hypothetical protein BJV78DRAFT_1118294 [Lactifluus subvellereus]
MISTPDDTPSSRNAGDQAQHPTPPTLGPRGPSPPPPPYANYQSTSQYVVAAAFPEPRETAERRFVKAFLVAVSIWVLAGIFVSSTVELSRLKRPPARWVSGIGVPGCPSIAPPTIEDGNIDSCVQWTGVSDRGHPHLPPFVSGAWSQARLNLPLDTDGIYFAARGAFESGKLYVGESSEAKDVSVKVFVHHHGTGSLARAAVCRLSRDDGQIGVGIFTPLNWHNHWPIGSRDNLRFVVAVELPSTRGGEVRYIPSFHADLPMFALAMGDLSAFHFGDLILKSTHSPIQVEGVIANTLKVHTTNGRITGTFNTTDSLALITNNSPVSVKIGAEHGKPDKSTEVFIQTNNGPIEADISLTSTSSPGAGGAFGVHTQTTNGPINILFDDSSVDSVLNFDAQSTNSPVHTVLHRAYEGTFSMQTTNADVVLDHSRNVEDPSGHGRKRRLFVHTVNRHVMYGEVKWVPSDNDSRAGSVNIATTNNLIKLTI